MKWKYKMTKNKVGFYTISSKSQEYFKSQDRQQFDGTLICATWAGVFWGMKEPQKGMHSQRRGPGWTPCPWVQQHEAVRISMKWQLLGCGSYCPLDTFCPVNAHMLEAWSPVCWRRSRGGGALWKIRGLCSQGLVKVVAPEWAKSAVFGLVSESIVSSVSLTPRCYFAYIQSFCDRLYFCARRHGDEARVFLIRYQVSRGSPSALSTHQEYKTSTLFFLIKYAG